MTLLLIAALIMIAVGFYANSAIAPGAQQIPMRWLLDGKATMKVPRQIGFAILPVIGIIAMLVLYFSGLRTTAVMLIAGIVFLAVQVLHLWLTQRWHAGKRT